MFATGPNDGYEKAADGFPWAARNSARYVPNPTASSGYPSPRTDAIRRGLRGR